MAGYNPLSVKPNKPTFFPYELDPAKKDKPYCLQMCKAQFWYNWSYGTTGNAYGNPRRDDWVENRSLAIGNPNVNKYIPTWSDYKEGAPGEERNATFLNLDLKPICHIPKFVDVIVSYIEKLQYEVQATAINPQATDKKDTRKWKIWAAKQMEAWMKVQEAAVGAQLVTNEDFPFDFDSKEELEMLLGMSTKEVEEEMMELGSELVQWESEWNVGKNVKRLLLKDLVVCGMCAIHTYVDKVSNKIKSDYVDIPNMIFPHWEFRGEYFENPSKIGFINMSTLAKLRAEAGDQFTDEQYNDIASRFSNMFGNGAYNFQTGITPGYINTDSQYNFWYSWGIPVMYLYWEETDRRMYQDRTYPDGFTETAPAAYEQKATPYQEYVDTANGDTQMKRQVYPSDTYMYYGAKWIPGTDYIFDWGPVADMGRNPFKPQYPLCPIKVARVSEKSMVDRLFPFEEQNILGWFRMQNSIAKSAPSGYSLNINTMKNATIDGKPFPVRKQVALYEQTGKLIWDSENPFDETGKQYAHPIMQLPSNLKQDLEAWQMLFSSNYEKMVSVSGLGALMLGGDPAPRIGKAVAETAVQGSENSITPISNIIVALQEMNCMDIVEKLKLLIQNNSTAYEGYVPSLGGAGTKYISITDSIVGCRAGIKMVARPTEAQREELKRTAQMAVANTSDPVKGGLFYNDYMAICRMINDGTNLKLVEANMNWRIKQNLQKMQQMAAANSQSQGEQQQGAIQSQAQMKSMLIDKQTQSEITINSAKAQDQDNVNRNSAQYRADEQTQVAAVKAQGKKEEKMLEASLK